MSLRAYNGTLLLSSSGTLAGSQSCCCATEPDTDPNRMVKCCYGGVCADITAAECQFLGGSEVADCSQCPQPPGYTAANCLGCCTADTIDARIIAYFNDASCFAVAGQGTGAFRYRGRFGEPISAKANITLQRPNSSSCTYSFNACFPLNEIGNVTGLAVQGGFVRRTNGVCEFQLTSLSINFQGCFAPQNNTLNICTQPAWGGSCGKGFAGAPEKSVVGVSTANCTGAAAGTEAELLSWAPQNNTFSGFIAGGAPRQRTIGNVECSSLGFTAVTEPSFLVTGRVAIVLV